MKKIELQEIIDACEEAGSEYLKLYRPLQGYEDELEFNVGIDDSLEDALNQYRGAILLVSHDEMFAKNIKIDTQIYLGRHA